MVTKVLSSRCLGCKRTPKNAYMTASFDDNKSDSIGAFNLFSSLLSYWFVLPYD